jgi:hypothetical protein
VCPILLISCHFSFTLSLASQEDSLVLEHLTGLRSLAVTHVGIREPTHFFDHPGPSWLKRQLRPFLSATHLQHIRLKVVVYNDSLVSRDAWAAIDSMFDGDAFPGLTSVEINPIPVRGGSLSEPWGQVHDKVRSLFPCLEERNMLDVCQDPCSRFD